jgi:hypothetical protein
MIVRNSSPTSVIYRLMSRRPRLVLYSALEILDGCDSPNRVTLRDFSLELIFRITKTLRPITLYMLFEAMPTSYILPQPLPEPKQQR